MISAASFVLLSWLIEVCLGWPDRLFQKIAHPVVWIGALISWLDTTCNHASDHESRRRVAGTFSVLLVIAVSTGVALLISFLLPDSLVGTLIEALLASSLLASRSLYQHVKSVHSALGQHGLTPARLTVGRIVGRQTSDMDESAIARASLESLAENTSDGVVAPLFWALLLGLPGLAAYKAINTLDSMIGHKTERYLAFGRFAARLDDVVNVIPARLSAFLFMSAAGSWPVQSVRTDAQRHRSVNAGWPESAMARALRIRLSGPRHYAGGTSSEPWINEDARDPIASDIQAGLKLYMRSMVLLALLFVVAALIS